MAGPDIVLFVVGALLFGGAVVALVAQGGGVGALGGSPTGLYDVTYSLAPHEAGKQAVPDFASAKFDAKVDMRNVSAIHITIQCTDTLPGATFQLQVQVTPPASIAKPAPKAGACGTDIKIDVTVTPPPAKTTVQGGTQADALAAVPHDANESRAVGTWSIAVQGGRGTPQPLPAGNPSGSIVVSADMWTPKLAAVPK